MKNILPFILTIFVLAFILFSSSNIYAQQKPLSLSPNVRTSINALAKEILLNGPSSKITSIKPQLDPQDYATVKNIGILPDSLLYIFKNIGRELRLFFTFDQTGKTYQILKDGNEKTLEALLITEKAANEKNTISRERLIQISARALDNVGRDFDAVSQTLDNLKKRDTIAAYLIQQEAFQFAGYYLKHQILLQKQEEKLNEQDFLTIESARVKHLGSIANIVVSENRDPVIFSEQLSQFISPQVGTNNSYLATIAILRDLENSANINQIPQLQKAQLVLQKELEIKLLKLPKAERLKQIEKYISFVHGNPIRDFQAYNFLSKNFLSSEMNILTQALKDKAAQDFKKHLNVLDSKDLQKQFVDTLFSNYPIDLRLLVYTEIQIKNNKNAEVQLERLQAIKSLLGEQICKSYGKNAKDILRTRFYKEALVNPSFLDVRIGSFLKESIQNCNGKTQEALLTIADFQTKINKSFIAEAKSESFTAFPTKVEAEKILKEENISVSSQDEQKVAEKIEEEIAQIEEEISENPTVLEKEIEQIAETITTKPQKTVVKQIGSIVNEEEAIKLDSETIVEEIIQQSEPTAEEITQKEEQIIEEIVDAAKTGETSPLVEELPKEVQEEISKETNIPLSTATPPPAGGPTLAPTVKIINTIAPVITSAPTAIIKAATPTPIPTVIVPRL